MTHWQAIWRRRKSKRYSFPYFLICIFALYSLGWALEKWENGLDFSLYRFTIVLLEH